MIEFGGLLASIFGGVFGGAIGFFLIAAVAVLLALPYLMLNRSTRGDAHESDHVPASENRFY